MRPKHEGPPTGNVGFRFVSFRAVRDVSCVRRRARDKSISRALLGGLISGGISRGGFSQNYFTKL